MGSSAGVEEVRYMVAALENIAESSPMMSAAQRDDRLRREGEGAVRMLAVAFGVVGEEEM